MVGVQLEGEQQVTGTRRQPSRARWIASVLLILYGFAKVNGSQFTVLDSELTRPMGEVSGFWLTWYYFGYSAPYMMMIALVEIIGGALLAIRRTALVAALALMPVVVNILVTDLFFGVNALPAVLVILACLVAVVVPHVPRLKEAMLLPSEWRSESWRVAALAVVMAGAWGFSYWIANYNNRAPTRIDGTWSVDAPATEQKGLVFFEYNRAHLAVFRSPGARDSSRHFEIDDQGVIRVWERWLSKGKLLFEGRETPTGAIELDAPKEDGGGRMVLTRAKASN